jgi:hypothetical protein
MSSFRRSLPGIFRIVIGGLSGPSLTSLISGGLVERSVLCVQKLNPTSYTIVGSVKPALKIYVVNSIFL